MKKIFNKIKDNMSYFRKSVKNSFNKSNGGILSSLKRTSVIVGALFLGVAVFDLFIGASLIGGLGTTFFTGLVLVGAPLVPDIIRTVKYSLNKREEEKITKTDNVEKNEKDKTKGNTKGNDKTNSKVETLTEEDKMINGFFESVSKAKANLETGNAYNITDFEEMKKYYDYLEKNDILPYIGRTAAIDFYKKYQEEVIKLKNVTKKNNVDDIDKNKTDLEQLSIQVKELKNDIKNHKKTKIELLNDISGFIINYKKLRVKYESEGKLEEFKAFVKKNRIDSYIKKLSDNLNEGKIYDEILENSKTKQAKQALKECEVRVEYVSENKIDVMVVSKEGTVFDKRQIDFADLSTKSIANQIELISLIAKKYGVSTEQVKLNTVQNEKINSINENKDKGVNRLYARVLFDEKGNALALVSGTNINGERVRYEETLLDYKHGFDFKKPLSETENELVKKELSERYLVDVSKIEVKYGKISGLFYDEEEISRSR